MVRMLATLLLLLSPVVVLGAELLTRASGKNCVHGLHQQPPGGPFSVFLFCDDAAGSNIGVVNALPGAGPGKIDLGELKEWNNWDVNSRFWQDKEWATDVTSFAWSPDLKFLYVATGEVYGTVLCISLIWSPEPQRSSCPTPRLGSVYRRTPAPKRKSTRSIQRPERSELP